MKTGQQLLKTWLKFWLLWSPQSSAISHGSLKQITYTVTWEDVMQEFRRTVYRETSPLSFTAPAPTLDSLFFLPRRSACTRYPLHLAHIVHSMCGSEHGQSFTLYFSHDSANSIPTRFSRRRGNPQEILNIWKQNNYCWLWGFIFIFCSGDFLHIQIQLTNQIFIVTITDERSNLPLVLISATFSWLLHFVVASQLLWHRKKYWSEFKKTLEYAPKVLAVFQRNKHKTIFVYTVNVLEINPQNLC